MGGPIVDEGDQATRLLKVEVPVELHVRLKRAKILTGTYMRTMVNEALDSYLTNFEDQAIDEPDAG